MRLENTFRVPLAVPGTWAVLLDVERVMACMPGAELLEIVDEFTYRAQVRVRLGPIQVVFKGTVRLDECDEAGCQVRVKATGQDISGRGGAQADIVFSLVDGGATTTVNVVTDLILTGAVAQYGRAGGMIADVSRQLVAQFADALKIQIEGSDEERARAVAQSGAAISALGMARAGLVGGIKRRLGLDEREEGKGDRGE